MSQIAKAFLLIVVLTSFHAVNASASGGLDVPRPTPTPGVSIQARLLPSGQATIAPTAPVAVQKAIAAGNQIVDKPYCLGGGHGRGMSRCYDCSGTVSHALISAGLLGSPLVSGSFARWGLPGRGRWITVYANGGHVYMVIAGLRLDTASVHGDGPGWSRQSVSPRGFAVRHPRNF